MAEAPNKKVKVGDDDTPKIPSIHDDLKALADFKVDKVLSESSQKKMIILQGSFEGHEGIGIVLLEKKSFVTDKINNFFCPEATVEKEFSNDIYGSYAAQAPKEFNDVKTTIIHPASDKQIEKYRAQKLYLVNETPEIYKTVCQPLLQDEHLNLQWVYNILEHKAETERIVFEDEDPETGFILAPDLKWDRENKESLYLLAIVHKLNIRSLRDLTAEHLPLLRNVLNKGTETIKKKYGLSGPQLRVYLHYRPTFYHLHVHFVALQYDAPGIFAEKAHILSTVISNLELMPDYYSKVTLPFVVRETEPLFTKLEEHALIQRVEEQKPSRSTMLSSILIELRPRLRACQVHINFVNPLSEEDVTLLQASILTPNFIKLNISNETFTLNLTSADLVLDTISSLIKNKLSLSFRVQTSPDAINGSFAREILISSPKTVLSKTIIPNINTKYDIFCRNCGSRFVIDLELKRVLPLPSTSWRELEWFCHKHDGDDQKSSSLLSPGEFDCFYTTGTWLLHAPSALVNVDFQEDSICCSLCSNQLGILLDDTATLWNFAVVWYSNRNTLGDDNLTLLEAIERDFTQIVLEATSNTIGAKLLLTSKTVNGPTSPLLLWALGSALEIIEWSPITSEITDVTLPQAKSALSMLYQTDVEEEHDEAQVIPIPLPLFEHAVEVLESANQMLPEQYRISNSFHVGYIYI